MVTFLFVIIYSDDPFSSKSDEIHHVPVYQNKDSSDRNSYNKQSKDYQSTDRVTSDNKDITVKEYFDEYVLPVHSKTG